MNRLVDKFEYWLRKHGAWAVLFFTVGWVLTSLAVSSEAWSRFFEVLAATGTLAAALAAFSAARIAQHQADTAQHQLDLQITRENEEKKPNILFSEPCLEIVINPKWEEQTFKFKEDEFGNVIQPPHEPGTRFSFKVRNISQYPINFYGIYLDSTLISPKGFYPVKHSKNEFLAPGEEKKLSVVSPDVLAIEEIGHANISFFYGRTGTLIHVYEWAFLMQPDVSELDATIRKGYFIDGPAYTEPVTSDEFHNEIQLRVDVNRNKNPDIP